MAWTQAARDAAAMARKAHAVYKPIKPRESFANKDVRAKVTGVLRDYNKNNIGVSPVRASDLVKTLVFGKGVTLNKLIDSHGISVGMAKNLMSARKTALSAHGSSGSKESKGSKLARQLGQQNSWRK